MKVPFLDVQAATAELRPELDAAWQRVADASWFVRGPELEAFEAEYAAWTGVPHAVGVGNGLDALALVLRAWGLGPGDEVLVPSHTFIATWLAVSSVGARPVPIDPGPDRLIDPNRVADAIGPATRALLPVHLYGLCVDVDALRRVAPGLLILEDAAQAQGATCRGVRTGALGDAAGISLYPGKNLGALGDAGIVTTPSAELAERVRALGHYGQRTRYHHDTIGTNSRLDELQAAFLRVKLRHLDGWNERRRRVADRYQRAFADLPVERPTVPPDTVPVWHLYVLTTPRRDDLAKHLAHHGVATQIHYPIAVHASGAYAGTTPPSPAADALAATSLSLPIGPHLRDDQVDLVIDGVRSYFGG